MAKFLARFAVSFEDTSFFFYAEHLIRYEDIHGDTRNEKPHNHCYRASFRVEGPLIDGCVVDFIPTQKVFKSVLSGWNGKFILPKRLQSSKFAKSIEKDIRFIKAKNATTEEIAAVVLSEFIQRLKDEELVPKSLKRYAFTLHLEENPGCFAEVTFAKKSRYLSQR
ncbi:MAG: 6-carboxytetrahydropterin synthase [Thermoguttaceae bacterium]|nr:6-carboxytetrahydropterin synthase [Thermoguttaceae bacterium]